ncbi:hypothetical protein ATANTOWER_020039 [Ataeniobius toweri]|uniref:Uncharacterized protein n=1 Tax=Ataeniobius toweri TaxID=208326 RepID=A0ABU7A2N4_9TELE|nr:hypothetical protein [Ataeniobius toweri]
MHIFLLVKLTFLLSLIGVTQGLRCSMPTESCLNQGRCEATPDGNGECKKLLELFLGGKWSEDVERNKWWTLMRPGGHREILCLAGFARSWATIVLLCD